VLFRSPKLVSDLPERTLKTIDVRSCPIATTLLRCRSCPFSAISDHRSLSECLDRADINGTHVPVGSRPQHQKRTLQAAFEIKEAAIEAASIDWRLCALLEFIIHANATNVICHSAADDI
jgi:hypothetical protein